MQEPFVEDNLEATPVLDRCFHKELNNLRRVGLDQSSEDEDERLYDGWHPTLEDFLDNAHE